MEMKFLYTISDYLLDVINFMGAPEIFGVPGDYNLQFLDHITHRSDMRWVGNANELNAAYMADGYARQKGFAAFVTTFGVGELSAVNGLGGSMAEHVPVLEIVGSPTTTVQNNHKLVHHTFGDGNFLRFEEAHRALGYEIAHLTAENAINEINRIAQYIFTTKKPAYINLPTDLVNIPVNIELKSDIHKLFEVDEKNNSDFEQYLVEKLEKANKLVVIAGHEAARFNLGSQIENFVKTNNIPLSVLGLGKGAVDETITQFIGTYNGELSDETTNKIVDQADTILLVGVKLTDSVTGAFTQSFGPSKTIALNYNEAVIFGTKYQGDYDFKQSLDYLSTNKLSDSNTVAKLENHSKVTPTSANLTQKFYDEALEQFISSSDTFVAEQGTSFFGLSSNLLPKNAHFIGQPLWGSIGYSFPAMLGSQIANPESRNILSVGEGSLHLTIQEFGMAFREKLNPIIFIIDNSGYTVERIIHGMTEPYNDVPKLEYKLIPAAFGATEDQYLFQKVTTEEELAATMELARKTKDKMIVVQVIMGAKDAPETLVKMGQLFEKQNH